MATSQMDVNRQEPDRCGPVMNQSSIDERVVRVLQKHGTQTLDHIGTLLPDVTWLRLFLAIDRLSRSGKISLWSTGIRRLFYDREAETTQCSVMP
jgi:hypothetical protein